MGSNPISSLTANGWENLLLSLCCPCCAALPGSSGRPLIFLVAGLLTLRWQLR